MLKIFPAQTEKEVEIGRTFFAEYLDFLKKGCLVEGAPEWVSDYCRDYEKSLGNLKDEYFRPEGCILLAKYKEKIAGCVGLRKLSDGVCEMKRLYVRPEYRRSGIGRALAEAVIEEAKALGYWRMRLDTVMEAAKALYYSMGFKEISPYEHIPLEGVIFMELKL